MFDFLNKIKSAELFQGVSWMFLSSLVGNLLRFLLVFIVIRSYSQEEFGLWASITSIAAIIVTGDFGLTNVLRNIASDGITKGVEGECYTRKCYFSSMLFFGVIVFLASIAVFILGEYIPYDSLFKTEDAVLRQQGINICSTVLLFFLLTIPLGVAPGMFFSYGEVKLNAVLRISNDVFTFLTITLLSRCHLRIDSLAIVYFGISLAYNLIGTLLFIYRRKWYGHFSLSLIDIYKSLSYMLPVGVKFLWIGFVTTFIPNVLTIYSGAMLGLSAAANINVAQKIYNFFTSIITSVLNPIWSKLSHLFYSNNLKACKNLYIKSLSFMTIVSLAVVLFTTLASDLLVQIIAGSQYETDYILFLLVGLCLISKVLFDNASLLLIATNRLNSLMIGYTLFFLVAVSVFPAIVRNLGFYYMMISLIICWMLYLLYTMCHTLRIMNRQEK